MRPLHSRIRFVTPPADRCTTLWAFGPLDWETTIADVKWMAVNTDIPVLDVSVIVHRNLDRKVLVLTPVDPWYSFALAMAANTARVSSAVTAEYWIESRSIFSVFSIS